MLIYDLPYGLWESVNITWGIASPASQARKDGHWVYWFEMAKKQKEIKPMKPEEVPELRADRDDALGYSREQFDFEDEKGKPVVKKKTVKKKVAKRKKRK